MEFVETKFIWMLLVSVNLSSRVSFFNKRVVLFSDSMGSSRWQRTLFFRSLQSMLRSRVFSAVQELVWNMLITVAFVRTAFVIADVLTKAWPQATSPASSCIFGLVHDGDPATVQVLQAFDCTKAHP